MHKILILLIVLGISLLTKGQVHIKKYVKENANLISNIDPDSTDFKDFESIGNAIGQSKIVMLGEQDHGDAPTFLAKTRLIKYLHEKMGFNVLAFESDFFTLNYGWDKLNKIEIEIDSFLIKNINGIWTRCDACQNLFLNIIPKSYNTTSHLIVTGLDNQMCLKYSTKYLTQKFDSVLRALNLPITKSDNYVSYILPLIDTLTHVPTLSKDTVFYNHILDQLYQIQRELNSKIEKTNFWNQVMENFIQTALELKLLPYDFYLGNNERDFQMAKNLQWLNTVKFPNEKIIIWAHNYHISKFGGKYTDKFLNTAKTMGTVYTSDSFQLNNTYILGFTSFQGQAGRITAKPSKVEKPNTNSFENWIPKSYNYAFIDFKHFNSNNPENNEEFYMKGSVKGIHKNYSAQWTKIFDGVFYIKDMYPCKIIE